MKRRTFTAILVVAIACITFAQPKKSNLTGSWKRVNISGAGNRGTEVMTFFHDEPYIYLLYRINDFAGERAIDLKGIINGKPHKQEVEGRPATFTVQWEGQNLILEIEREASFGYAHSKRKLIFSEDGKTMTAERTDYQKDGKTGTSTEKWEKQ
jgi:hypothetical protein